MVLEANIDVINALRKFYMRLKFNHEFPSVLKRDSKEEIETFAGNLGEIIAGLKMHALRAILLVNIIGDRKHLVCFFHFICISSNETRTKL